MTANISELLTELTNHVLNKGQGIGVISFMIILIKKKRSLSLNIIIHKHSCMEYKFK